MYILNDIIPSVYKQVSLKPYPRILLVIMLQVRAELFIIMCMCVLWGEV